MTSIYSATKDWPYQVSAGGVVYRNSGNQREYALLYRSQERWGSEYGDSYHLPKGRVEPGETLEQTAIREVEEESGLRVKVIAFLGTNNRVYESSIAGFKLNTTIIYFLCEFTQATGGVDAEHDSMDWKSTQEAIELLSKVPKDEDKFIKRAEEYFKKFDHEQ